MGKFENYLREQNALEKELRNKVIDRVGEEIFYKLIWCHIQPHELIHIYNQILALRDDHETEE